MNCSLYLPGMGLLCVERVKKKQNKQNKQNKRTRKKQKIVLCRRRRQLNSLENNTHTRNLSARAFLFLRSLLFPPPFPLLVSLLFRPYRSTDRTGAAVYSSSWGGLVSFYLHSSKRLSVYGWAESLQQPILVSSLSACAACACSIGSRDLVVWLLRCHSQCHPFCARAILALPNVVYLNVTHS